MDIIFYLLTMFILVGSHFNLGVVRTKHTINKPRPSLSISGNLDWPLYQLYVKNVFLNGDLEEKTYMGMPSRFESKNTANKVCMLKKSFYGLKQSPRASFHRFTKVLKKMDTCSAN